MPVESALQNLQMLSTDPGTGPLQGTGEGLAGKRRCLLVLLCPAIQHALFRETYRKEDYPPLLRCLTGTFTPLHWRRFYETTATGENDCLLELKAHCIVHLRNADKCGTRTEQSGTEQHPDLHCWNAIYRLHWIFPSSYA